MTEHDRSGANVAIESGIEAGSERPGRLTSRVKRLGSLQDLATLPPEGRSRERRKRLVLAGVTAVGFRFLSIVVALVTVPLMLGYLGPEKYGLWVTVTSFATLLLFADLGLGQGLVNGISAAEGNDQRESLPSLVASAFFMLVGVAVLLGIVFAVIYPIVPWSHVLTVRSPRNAQLAGPAVAVLVAMTLFGLPFGLVVRIRLALQEAFVANLWMSVGSMVSLGALGLAIGLGATLPWLVFAFACGPLTASLLNGGFLLRRRPSLVPRLGLASVTQGREMLSLGLLFFVVQVSGAGAYQTDNIVIARIVGVAAVTQYAVPMQLFMLTPTVIGLLTFPLWPAYREALARKDHAWFWRTARRSFVISVGAGVFLSAILALTARPVIHLWAGRSVTPAASLVVALALFSVLFTASTVAAVFLYAVDAVGFVAASSAAFVVLNLALSIVLTRSIGVPGPAWGSVIAMVPNLGAQLIYIRRWRSRNGFDSRSSVIDASDGRTA